MKILHVLDHSLPLHSGYSFRTAAILREQRARGWSTLHLTSPRHGITAGVSAALEDSSEGLSFFRTPASSGGLRHVPAVGAYLEEMRATSRRLDALIKEHRPDVLHAHSPVLNALPALAAARRHRIPVVYEVRACWEDAAVDHGRTREGSIRYRLSRALETWALKRVDHVTCICEGLRQDIVARGVAPDRVTVIPNAVDTEKFAFDPPADPVLKAELGFERNTVIGFIGSFYAYEGLDLLIEALPSVLAERPEVRVLLVGGGPHEASLRAAARRLQVEDKVRFAGRVPHGDVARYYGLVDVLAYPRRSMRLTELVTPLKPLEAMAQGKVLLASDVGGHRELIRDGETGVLFRADDAQALARALLGLLAGRTNWPTLRACGRAFVERERTWTDSVARYAPVFGRLNALRA